MKVRVELYLLDRYFDSYEISVSFFGYKEMDERYKKRNDLIANCMNVLLETHAVAISTLENEYYFVIVLYSNSHVWELEADEIS